LIFLDLLHGTAGLMFDALALDLRTADEGNTALVQPLRQTAKCLERVGLMPLNHDPDALN
jgi:hypothetical protein